MQVLNNIYELIKIHKPFDNVIIFIKSLKLNLIK